ncbi:hypothetical protein ElyMa_005262600 [Elysia marginata]|uniref:Ig-like domain-containing protein n=1 Tax=Elysia marginata TaxID=1093978 RepID=A0AAV4K191_9GAST|nr:hypothetical protein ElyMa_005262600 [Elysia marginata]
MDCSKTRMIIIIYTCMIVAIGQVVLGAPERVITSEARTYIVSDTKVPFASIASRCSSLAGRPTTIASNQEYQELIEALAREDPQFLSSLWFPLTKDSSTGEWGWADEASNSALWFNNSVPFVQEPNNKGDDCDSLDICICASLTYEETMVELTADTHKLFDTCCTDSHRFLCEDLNECACSTSDATCMAVVADCQEPTPQCLDLIGGYRCIDLLPSPELTFGTSSPTTLSVGSQVILNCSVILDHIPYIDDIPKDTQWTLEYTKNGKGVMNTSLDSPLYINSVNSLTEGSYECLYKVGSVRSTNSVAMDVTLRPLTTPTVTAPAADFSIGETVDLTCFTTSPGEKLFEWTLPFGDTYQTSQETYSFQMTGWPDLGFYTCRVIIPALALNSQSSDPFVIGLKLVTPVIVNMKETSSFALNDTLKLQCNTTDSITLSWIHYNWQKDGETIAIIFGIPELSSQVSDALFEGVYTCFTTQGAMQSQKSNEITLKYKWSSVPQLQVNTTLLSPGVTVEFKCSSEEPGNVTLQIFKNGQVSQTDTVRCSSDKTFLHQECWHFAAAGQDTEGTYFCRANIGGSLSSLSNFVSLTLENIETPTLSAETSSEIANHFSLSCSIGTNGTAAESYNDLIYIFQIETANGTTRIVAESTDPTINITLTTFQDEGDYWCNGKRDWLKSNESNLLHLALTKYEVAIETSALLIPKGQQVTITCSPLWDEPVPRTLRLCKDTNQIMLVELVETSVVIGNFRETDEGAYSCQIYSTMKGQWFASNSTTLTLLSLYQICTCPCTNTTVEVEVTQEVIDQSTSQIERELVTPKNLSMRERKKTCATDYRASSTVYGGASIILLIGVVTFVIFLDGVNLYKLGKPRRHNVDSEHQNLENFRDKAQNKRPEERYRTM